MVTCHSSSGGVANGSSPGLYQVVETTQGRIGLASQHHHAPYMD